MTDVANAGLAGVAGLRVLPGSVVAVDDVQLGAVQTDADQQLAILAPVAASLLGTFEGESTQHGERVLLVGPRSSANIQALRECLPWLRPQILGLRTSAGFGDRLGLATPGHIRALRAVGTTIAPVFPQQSIREMDRTGRSPRQVVDDATWGVFAEGWREPFGADADHLKTSEDVERCLPVGYTFWTIDPGDLVDASAETASTDTLRRKLADLPWRDLEDSPDAFAQRYFGQTFDLEDARITFDEASAARAAAKYGRPMAHTAALFRLLSERLGSSGWELEVAVDETQPVTTPLEHIYMAQELRRLGVRWVSYAPRYLGEFEKGIGYIGGLDAFERYLALHAAIARQLGPYKLSLHSGSDKFSVYPIAAHQTRGLVHLKTAGTSYVEALRTIANLDPAFFRELYGVAREQFETARVGYHISGQVANTPESRSVADDKLPGLLDDPNARQVLHVTYGQILTWRDPTARRTLYDRLMAVLRSHPDAYASTLERHFVRHLAPFAAVATPQPSGRG